MTANGGNDLLQLAALLGGSQQQSVSFQPARLLQVRQGAVSKSPDWSHGPTGSSRCCCWLSPAACIRRDRQLLAVACHSGGLSVACAHVGQCEKLNMHFFTRSCSVPPIVHIAAGRTQILAISPATPAAGLKLCMPGARVIPTSVRRSQVPL